MEPGWIAVVVGTPCAVVVFVVIGITVFIFKQKKQKNKGENVISILLKASLFFVLH